MTKSCNAPSGGEITPNNGSEHNRTYVAPNGRQSERKLQSKLHLTRGIQGIASARHTAEARARREAACKVCKAGADGRSAAGGCGAGICRREAVGKIVHCKDSAARHRIVTVENVEGLPEELHSVALSYMELPADAHVSIEEARACKARVASNKWHPIVQGVPVAINGPTSEASVPGADCQGRNSPGSRTRKPVRHVELKRSAVLASPG